MQLYTEENFLKVIPQFLSPDENRRILADALFFTMCTHNSVITNNDDYNKSLLKDSAAKLNVPNIPSFITHVMGYHYKKSNDFYKQMNFSDNDQTNHFDYAPQDYLITTPKKISSQPLLMGMNRWLSFAIGQYPEMLQWIEHYLTPHNAYEFNDLLLAIHQNNHDPILFKNIVKTLVAQQSEHYLLATLMDSNETLQLLVIDQLAKYSNFTQYGASPFNYIKNTSNAVVDAFLNIFMQQKSKMEARVYNELLEQLAHLADLQNYRLAEIRPLVLEAIQKSEDTPYTPARALKNVMIYEEDRTMLDQWANNDDIWQQYFAYLSYPSITNPSTAILNSALNHLGNYDLADGYPHCVAVQAILYWHQLGIKIPSKPINQYIINVCKRAFEEYWFDILDEEDAKFISTFSEQAKESLPELKALYAAYLAHQEEMNTEEGYDDNEESDEDNEWGNYPVSLDRDVFKQNFMQLLPDTSSQPIIVKPISDMNAEEIRIALENLTQLKDMIDQQRNTPISDDFIHQLNKLENLVDEITEKIQSEKLTDEDQRHYLTQLNALIEEVKTTLSDYLDQELSGIEAELKDASWNVEFDNYTAEDEAEFISSIALPIYELNIQEEDETTILLELIQKLESV